MASKLVLYSAPVAPQVDGLTTLFVIREMGKIANSIHAILNAWVNPSHSGYVQTGVVTVATLPTAATTNKGARYMVSDANATMTAGIGAVVAAGGANVVPVYSDGAAWRIG